jgi:hypothetical protein
MSSTRLSPFGALSAAIVVAASAVALLSAARRHDTVSRVDFGLMRVATSPAYDARLAPATDANVREFIIPVTHNTIEIEWCDVRGLIFAARPRRPSACGGNPFAPGSNLHDAAQYRLHAARIRPTSPSHLHAG